ncbi:MAG: CPBP family intramembrane glutamic endopeptidase [Candidatus Hermodarchaeota archaeon]
MKDKEIQDSNGEQKNSDYINSKDLDDKSWLFCPVCGNKIPKLQKLKFCIKCGTDLNYLKEHKQLKPTDSINPYIQTKKYPQQDIPLISYEPLKISDEEILNTKNFELWGTMPSIGISMGAFLIMNFATAGVLAIMIFFATDLEALLEFLVNPYFIAISSFFELIFVLIPVLYVGKYLRNPSLKNRLGLLGFTSKGLNKKDFLKEILIGLGFAVAGYYLVQGIAFLTEIGIEFFFGIEIIQDVNSGAGEAGILLIEGDILSIILLSIAMILLVGTSEEILFRGFMQKGLTRSLGSLGGILVSAFIFAMIHVLGIILLFIESPILILISFILYFIPYFIISVVLGLIYYWRNENLIAVVITHGVFDALTIILAYISLYGF